jgi:hypothetical protein
LILNDYALGRPSSSTGQAGLRRARGRPSWITALATGLKPRWLALREFDARVRYGTTDFHDCTFSRTLAAFEPAYCAIAHAGTSRQPTPRPAEQIARCLDLFAADHSSSLALSLSSALAELWRGVCRFNIRNVSPRFLSVDRPPQHSEKHAAGRCGEYNHDVPPERIQ